MPVWVLLMPREYQYPFELRHLVYFREVARQLHFRKAAEALAVAQPALSRSVAQLEEAMGVDLLTRTRRRVELTAAGRAFLDRIEPLLRALDLRWPFPFNWCRPCDNRPFANRFRPVIVIG